jgi:cell division protein FtsN
MEEKMEEKNELNDLFLGEENKSGGSKKLFLIIAGALLVFFVTIGIMKFVNSDDEKPKNNTTTASAKPAVVPDANASAIPNDEKLNEIVRKLQEDAKNQAMQSTPLDASGNSAPTTSAVATPTQSPKSAPTPVAKSAPVQPMQPVQPAPAPVKPQVAPAPVVKATPAPVAQVAPTPKSVMAEAVTPVQKPVHVAPKPKPKPVVKPKPTAPAGETVAATASGAHFIQIGYFDGQKNVDTLVGKATAAGFKATTKAAQVNGKNVTKIMVGPFNTKEEAKAELAKVRQQLKPDAFLAQ